jgi:O-antigen/teichoic acid export membrane protein
VIGALLSVAQVTAFAIAARLVMYATEIVATMASVFTPIFSDLHARDAKRELVHTLQKGNHYSAFLAVPIAVGIALLGVDVIHLWMGPGYEQSATLLTIIGVPMCVYVAQSASTRVLYGMAKHHFLAKVLLYEGVANVALSCALARPLGLMGVALGTAVPLLITSILIIPVHVCRTLNLRLRDYGRSFVAPLVAALPLLGFWIMTASVNLATDGKTALALKVVGGGALYLVTFAALTRAVPSVLGRTIEPRPPA